MVMCGMPGRDGYQVDQVRGILSIKIGIKNTLAPSDRQKELFDELIFLRKPFSEMLMPSELLLGELCY